MPYFLASEEAKHGCGLPTPFISQLIVAVLSGQLRALSSASRSDRGPPLNFVNKHLSTTNCRWPHPQTADLAMPPLYRLARYWPRLAREWVNPFNTSCSKLLLFEESSAILVYPTIFNFWHSGALALSPDEITDGLTGSAMKGLTETLTTQVWLVTKQKFRVRKRLR